MSTSLWIAQIVLAVIFVVAGTIKLTLNEERIARKFGRSKFPLGPAVRLLGLAEILGAAGLTLPAAVGYATFLTPLAAGCLLVLMVGAVAVKVHRRESPALPIVTAASTLFVMLGHLCI